MANYSLPDHILREKGFIKKISGADYTTVAGVAYIAHDSNRLLQIETRITHDEPEFIDAAATVSVLNLGAIEAIRKNDKITEQDKDAIIAEIVRSGKYIGMFSGHARSKAVGGKSAEGTNPLEVAETSAIGRALRAAGFGEMESFATADEVATAVSRQTPPRKAPTPHQQLAKALSTAHGTKLSVEDLNNLARERFNNPQIQFRDLDASSVAGWLTELTQPSQDEVPF